MPPHHSDPLVLAFDSGSPVTSAALGRGARVVARRAVARPVAGATSASAWSGEETLLALIDAVLAQAQASPPEIGAVCVLRGPGSFTGLRVGLATAIGLRQSLGVEVAAMPTLRVLAEAAAAPLVTAVVDALRGEWFVQTFRRFASGLEALAPPERISAHAVRPAPGGVLAGFGADRLAASLGLDRAAVRTPDALAPVAVRLASDWAEWDPGLLSEPMYLRAPAVSPASPRR